MTLITAYIFLLTPSRPSSLDLLEFQRHCMSDWKNGIQVYWALVRALQLSHDGRFLFLKELRSLSTHNYKPSHLKRILDEREGLRSHFAENRTLLGNRLLNLVNQLKKSRRIYIYIDIYIMPHTPTHFCDSLHTSRQLTAYSENIWSTLAELWPAEPMRISNSSKSSFVPRKA